jgi:hypothetical protein
MERLWLRPLSRVPKKQYLKLAKKMAARPIEQGTRPRQKYFFNHAASLTLKKKTLAWAGLSYQASGGLLAGELGGQAGGPVHYALYEPGRVL